jgi:hypothetical protein
MKLPRDLSGRDLAKALRRNWNHHQTSQVIWPLKLRFPGTNEFRYRIIGRSR